MKNRLVPYFVKSFRLSVFACFLWVFTACSSAPIPRCTPGPAQCSIDKRAVEMCKQSYSTGRWELQLVLCSGTQMCTLEREGARCASTVQCDPNVSCQIGTFRCNQHVLMRCDIEPNSGCPAETVVRVCGNGESCDVQKKACRTEECTPQIVQFGKRCIDNALHWFNDCGQKGKKIQLCKATEECDAAEGACKPRQCVPKQDRATKKCEQNSVYWFDDCGVKKQLAETCPVHLRCIKGACTQCKPQKSESIKKCVDNAVYWFDDCEQQGKKIQDCAPSEICKQGACTHSNPKCEGQALCSKEHQKKCEGTGFKVCTKNADGCLVWSQQTVCSSEQKCVAGECVKKEPECTSKCTTKGASECVGSQIRFCQESGIPNCLEWTAPTPCSQGLCQAGKCVASCNNTCTSGQKKCAGSAIQECIQDAQGCWDWGSPTSCGAGKQCSQNMCSSTSAFGKPVGRFCTRHTQCQSRICLLKGSGRGVCLTRCSTTPCASGFKCTRINGSKYCVQSCTSAASCDSGLICFYKMCLP